MAFAALALADFKVSNASLLTLPGGDVGIAALARIVRQERTPEGSRIAAALLAREWAPDDPYWPDVSRRITAGLGTSRRPAARFLRAVVTATTQPAGDATVAAVAEAVAAARILLPPAEATESGAAAADDADTAAISDRDLRRMLRRCLIQVLAAAGRRDEALTEAGQLFADCRGLAAEDRLVAQELAWLADRGLGGAVDLLQDRLVAEATTEPRLLYAAAIASLRRGDAGAEDRAEPLAARAHSLLVASQDFEARRRTAAALAEWGAIDWAVREYLAVLDATDAPAGEFALAGSNCAEFLHDHGRDAEAAEILRRMLAGRAGQNDAMDHVLMQEGIDPKSKRSRMHYFAACAAAARGDAAEHSRLLDESLREDPSDVDALIAAYGLAADGNEREAVTARVKKALGGIEDQINAVPKDPSAYNEYAWLVANTSGDVLKATAFSKRSLELLFDAVGYLEVAAYLDTLAHCRAAAGDRPGAVRTQWLAVRQEPHSPTIRRNYERFRKAAAP